MDTPQTPKDERVQSAISHWAPRFVINGVPLTDFQEVTASISSWDDWCKAWSARAAIHEELGNTAHGEGFHLSAAEHWTRSSLLVCGVSIGVPLRCVATHSTVHGSRRINQL